MDISKFEKVHNRQIAYVVFIFFLFVVHAYFTTPKHLQAEFFQQNDPMFAFIIGAMFWMVGAKVTIFLVKKGLIK